MGSVSYTHLDVYKRQPLSRLREMSSPCLTGSFPRDMTNWSTSPCPVVSAPLIKQRKCFRKSTRKMCIRDSQTALFKNIVFTSSDILICGKHQHSLTLGRLLISHLFYTGVVLLQNDFWRSQHIGVSLSLIHISIRGTRWFRMKLLYCSLVVSRRFGLA